MFKQAQNNKLWNIHLSTIFSSNDPSEDDFKRLIRSLYGLSDWSFCIFSWWVSKVPTISFWCNLFCWRRQSSDNPYIKDNNSQSHINYEYWNESIFTNLKSFPMVIFQLRQRGTLIFNTYNFHIHSNRNWLYTSIMYVQQIKIQKSFWNLKTFNEKSKWNVWNTIKLPFKS